MAKKNFYLIFFIVFLLGFILRIFFVDKIIVGDLLSGGEWGEQFIKLGSENLYFKEHLWVYGAPNYPPLMISLFGGLCYLNEHRYVLAQLHNLVKFPPAAFIVYFYKYGYILLLKLPSILADLGIGLAIFWVIKKLSEDKIKGLIGAAIYLLNPLTIFISGIWGQTDSLVSLFAIFSFIFLSQKKIALSLPLFFISFYLKPLWGTLIPLYLYLLYLSRPKLSSLLIGGIISFLIFYLSTSLFDKNIFPYAYKLFTVRFNSPLREVGKASVSAFNFQTIFLKIDKDLPVSRILFVPARIWGFIAYTIINLFTFSFVKKQKNLLYASITGIFIIGFGSFLFLTNILERYFFPALAPLIILMVINRKILIYGIILNLILMANIIWSFYRHSIYEIRDPFINSNYLLIRFLSFINVFLYAKVILNLRRVVQFKRG